MTDEVKTPTANAEQKETNLVEGLSALSSEKFIEEFLLDDDKKDEKKEEKKPEAGGEEKKAPIAKTEESPDAKAAADKAALEKKSSEDKALVDLEKIRTEEYKGKTPEEVKALKEKEAKEDAEKFKGKTPGEIAALKLEEIEDEKPFVPELKLPEEKKEEAKKEENEAGWKDLAKEIGFETKEDNFEEFKTNLEDFYKKKHEVNLGKYNAETQRFIEFLEAGGTAELFLEPLKPVNELKSLSDIDLITKDFELRKWPADKIEKEITRMTEADEVDTAAFKIREKLDDIEEKIKQRVVDEKTKAENRQNKFKQSSAADQLKGIKDALNTVGEFMETPITDKHKDYITKNFEAGKYADIMKDPKVMADFLLYYQFGKDGLSNLKNKAFNEAKLKYKKDRHNIPPVPDAGGKGSPSNHQNTSPEGNWSALENFQELIQEN